MDGVGWGPLQSQYKSSLERPFRKKYTPAIKNMGSHKSLDPNGMTREFTNLRDILKLDLLEEVQESFKNGIINKRTNETYIPLI